MACEEERGGSFGPFAGSPAMLCRRHTYEPDAEPPVRQLSVTTEMDDGRDCTGETKPRASSLILSVLREYSRKGKCAWDLRSRDKRISHTPRG